MSLSSDTSRADAATIINAASTKRSCSEVHSLVTGLPEGVSIASYLIIPTDIEAVLVANGVQGGADNLRERFTASLVGAVQASFNHKSTQVRVITEREIKLRTNLVLELFREAYWGQEMSALHILDILGDALIQLILDTSDLSSIKVAAQRGSERIEQTQRPSAWRAPPDPRLIDNDPYVMPSSISEVEDLSQQVIDEHNVSEL